MTIAPHVINIEEYGLTVQGFPLVAMTDGVAEAIQRAGLATREHVMAALTTACDLSADAGNDPSSEVVAGGWLLITIITMGGSSRELWLEYVENSGYVACWPGER